MNHGKVHRWVPDPKNPFGGRIVTEVVPLAHLDVDGDGVGRLWGRYVRVRNAAVLHEPDPRDGRPLPVPLGDARPDGAGHFDFDPARGGARVDKYTLRSEKYRLRYVSAARFGEVNAYYHVDRIASRVHALLEELGAPPLPRVVVVVNAHHAAVPLPDGTRDGVRRADRWVPFEGGHYRLPSRRQKIVEREPVARDGEIHLGPGWKVHKEGALVEAAGTRYRHVASHNAGTIYHEYGHHITRHTADFVANALRAPDRQSNLKTALDEGFCDYCAATMLDTPHIWAWHRRHDDREMPGRSLASPVTMADYDHGERADPHRNGTIWAAALWDLRTRMESARASHEEGAHACDKLVLKTLLLLGAETGASPGSSAETSRASRERAIRRFRASFSVALDALLRADRMLHDGAFQETILACFSRRGIDGGAGPRDASRNGAAGPAGANGEVPPRPRSGARLHSGWQESPLALVELEAARTRMLRHVPAEDFVETRDLFARGELSRSLRALGEPQLSVLATGDTMLGGRSLPVIEEHGLDHPFRALRPLLRRAAIVLGNLEGPIAAEARSHPRNFSYRVQPRMAVALKRAGFHVMNLANNHLTDCGRRGVVETIDLLTRAGIAPLGAGVDERAAHRPVILEAHGLRVGFLGYYWNRRTAARANLAGSAMDPPEALAADIGRLREEADRVVVTFHWGVPYVREPSSEDRAKARFAIDCGADAVIGHHVHVIQPFEIHRGRPIFHGIGNCAFGSGNSKAEGLLVGLRFEAERTRLFVYALNVKNRDPRVDYQPKVLRGDAARKYLGRLVALSGSDGQKLRLEEFRATVDLPWTSIPVRLPSARLEPGQGQRIAPR